MSRIGGTSVVKTVNNVMRFIIDHSLALNLRITSTSGKIVFGGTNCARLVKGRKLKINVMQNIFKPFLLLEAVKAYYDPSTGVNVTEVIKSQITDEKLESAIAKWLRDSSNRGKEGQERLAKRKSKAGNVKVNEEPAHSGAASGDVGSNPFSATNNSDSDGN